MTEHKSLTEALGAFQAELPKVGKGSTNPAFKTKYAGLTDIMTVVLPALAKHGLAWVSAPTVTADGFVLRYELRHTSGDSVGGDWPLPDPDKSTPQVLGSALTYGRRYTLSAVTGIAPDDDDDGNAASAAAPSHRRAAPPVTSRAPGNVLKPSLLTRLTEAVDDGELRRVWASVTQAGLGHDDDLIAAKDARKASIEALAVTSWAVAEVPS